MGQRAGERETDEALRLHGRQGDPGQVAGGAVDHEPGLPAGPELGVELVQGLDLEPARQEDQQPAPDPQHRPGTQLLAAGQGGAEHREVQRDTRDAEPGRGLEGGDDQQLVHPRVRGTVAAHQVE